MRKCSCLHVNRSSTTFSQLIILICILAGLVLPAIGGETAVPGAGGSPMPATVEAEPFGDADWKDKVVAIPIVGAIVGKPFSTMPEVVAKALDKAEKDGARLVVLEIDSPGGIVDTCDQMAKRIFDAKVPVVSLIVHKAISGGAMVASAAPRIAMTRTARMGDIQPMPFSITGGGGQQMDDRTAEKIEVDIRTIMKVYAQHYDRPHAVMEAMVSRGSSLYQVHFREGETEYLTGHELELLEKNIERGRDTRHIADTKILKPEGKLLELSAQQALEYGIASEVVDSRDAFYEAHGIEPGDVVKAEIPAGELDIKKLLPKLEDLGLPVWVIILLGVFLVVGVAGLVTEYHAPGTGLPAAIGIIGFASFFALLLMHDRGSPVGIVLFLIGIALLVVEIMILPGFGIAGIAGIVGILGGLLLAFTPAWDSEYMRKFMWHEVGAFTILMGLGLVAALAMIYIISRYGEKMPFIGSLFMTESQPAGVNPNPETLAEEPHESQRLKLADLKGRTGVAESMLRPAGKVRLDTGELLDVVTDGVYVEAGTRVAVTEAAPNRIVVGVERK